MAAHTHWRITCDGLGYVQLAEVAFLSAGLTDLSVGGTASASSEYSAALPASAAFDKDASGSWWCTATGSLPAWLAYAHPTAVEPVYVRITAHPTYPPISLGLQHSDDGITWSAAVPLIFSSGGPIASGAATVFVPSVGSRPIVWQSNEVRELPAGDKLPADVIPSHGHAMGDVAGLDAALDAKEASIAAGTTAQYFRGNKTWRDFFTDVRAATLTGLSTATNAAITAADTVLAALGKLQKQISAHLASTANAHPASAISNTPSGGISATTVQAAINELDAEKASVASVREKLTAARTYYVRTDGNDSNSGLANTSGGAFLTIQKAVDVCAALDFNGFSATVQVGDGTWTAPATVSSTVNGILTIAGNATTPDNVLWSLSSGSCLTVSGPGVRVVVKDMKLQTGGVSGVASSDRASVTAANCTFGACGYAHVAGVSGGSVVVVGTTCRIVGSAPAFANLDNANLDITLATFTLTGTPAFSNAFIACQANSYARCVQPTFSGSATGSRYSVNTNSVINVNAAGATFLPGNAAGTAATGGQYA